MCIIDVHQCHNVRTLLATVLLLQPARALLRTHNSAFHQILIVIWNFMRMRSFIYKIFVDFYLHSPWITQKTRNGVAKGRPWVQHHNCSAGAGAGLKPTNKNVPFYHHQAAERLCAQQSQAAVRDWNQKNARLSSMLHRQIICICTTPQHHNNTTAISRLPPQAQSYPAFCLQHKLCSSYFHGVHPCPFTCQSIERFARKIEIHQVDNG